MHFSIIIPTYNEEGYLGTLLRSIREQAYSDYEIIVADNHSQDRTRMIAHAWGARIVDGGLPATGRNRGAAVAQGKYLLFLDADIILPPQFLAQLHERIRKGRVQAGSCRFIPISDALSHKVIHSLANVLIAASRYVSPHAAGFCVFCRKDIFWRVGGFDETLKLAEDHNFALRVSAAARFRILRSPVVFISVRRFEKEGTAQVMRKYMYCEFYRLFKGEIRDDIIEYEFGKFS